MSETTSGCEAQETRQAQPQPEQIKHRRRSRRPLIWQVHECLMKIDRELEAGTERPARLTLLKAKLGSLMSLLAREDAQKERDAALAARKIADAQNEQKPTVNPIQQEIQEVLAQARRQQEDRCL